MAIATVPRNVRRFGICIRLLYHASLVLARRTLVVKRPLFPIIGIPCVAFGPMWLSRSTFVINREQRFIRQRSVPPSYFLGIDVHQISSLVGRHLCRVTRKSLKRLSPESTSTACRLTSPVGSSTSIGGLI